MTALLPAQRSGNRDSMTFANALATLVEAGFTVSATAELVGDDGTEVKVFLSQRHHPMVRMSRVVEGVHMYMGDYESHHVVDGVQVPFDTQSAAEYAIGLLGASTTWAVTR